MSGLLLAAFAALVAVIRFKKKHNIKNGIRPLWDAYLSVEGTSAVVNAYLIAGGNLMALVLLQGHHVC